MGVNDLLLEDLLERDDPGRTSVPRLYLRDPWVFAALSGLDLGVDHELTEEFVSGSTTRRNFARVTVTGDTGAANGYAIAEAAPTSPLATDKHFQEIGHLLQTRTGSGLALTALHFN